MTEAAVQPDQRLKVPVLLQVGAGLSGLDAEPVRSRLVAALEEELGGILTQLAIPGRPQVSLIVSSEDELDGRLLRWFIHNVPCRYPDGLLLDAWCAVSKRLRSVETTLDALRAWLEERLSDDARNAEGLQFLRLAIAGVVWQRPSWLLNPDLVSDFLTGCQPAEDVAGLDRSAVQVILSQLLDQWISLDDRQAICEKIIETWQSVQPVERVTSAVEQLLAARKTGCTEICLNPATLRELTLSQREDDRSLFALLRDGMFYELGLRLPEMTWKADPQVEEGQMVLRVNQGQTLPVPLLGAQEVLVYGEPEPLVEAGLSASPVTNPANGERCSRVPLAESDRLPSELVVRTPLGYLVLALSAFVRRYAAFFVDQVGIEIELESFKLTFPSLERALRERWSLGMITRAMRFLVEEGISIRDYPQITQAMIDFDYLVTDQQYIVFDERLPVGSPPDEAWLNDPLNLASFVRSKLKRLISQKYTRGRAALLVNLLDQPIEQVIYEADGHGLSQDQEERILTSVRFALREQSYQVEEVPILTTVEVRPHLRRLLAQEWPDLPVLAYQELSPEMNIKPLVRIAWL